MDITVSGWLRKMPIKRNVGTGRRRSVADRLKGVGHSKRRFFVLFQGEKSSNLTYYKGEDRKTEKGKLVVNAESVLREIAGDTTGFEVRRRALVCR